MRKGIRIMDKRGLSLRAASAAAAIALAALTGCAHPSDGSYVGTTWYSYDDDGEMNSELVELSFGRDETWSLLGAHGTYGGEFRADGSAATLTYADRVTIPVLVTGPDGERELKLEEGGSSDSTPDDFKGGAVFYESAEAAEEARKDAYDEARSMAEDGLSGSFVWTARDWTNDVMVDLGTLIIDDGTYEFVVRDRTPMPSFVESGSTEGLLEVDYDAISPVADPSDGVSLMVSFDGGREVKATVYENELIVDECRFTRE